MEFIMSEFSITSQIGRVTKIAQALARENRNARFSASHLLRALLNDEIELTSLLESLGKNIFYLRDWADFGIQTAAKSTQIPETISGDESFQKILTQAELTRLKLAKDEIDALCLLLAVIQPGVAFSPETLKTLPLTYDEVFTAVIDNSEVKLAVTPPSGQKKMSGSVNKYCKDRTQVAREERLDPVVGRDAEIDSIFEILGRRNKNSVLIIGEPGVGKTSLVNGISQRLIKDDVPLIFKSRQILELDILSLIAGASYKGEAEERMKNVLRDIKSFRNAILFIDDIHVLLDGAGSSMSFGNLLKSELADGELTIIGISTIKDYHKSIEKDSSLNRLFEKLTVEEPDDELALQILTAIAPKYEKHHGIGVPETTLPEVIRLSRRYIKDSWLPDTAVDLLDRAMSAVVQKNEKLHKDQHKANIEADDIAELVSRRTGIPVGKLQTGEREKLQHMEASLQTRVVGQDHAIQTISEAIRQSRSGLSEKGKPIGGFFLLGPTGTGKTETAKALAEFLFDDEKAMIRIDMSEFHQEHNASLLIGAPPGYVGYEEGGLLVNKIREKPFSVVLFDEIEKAHSSVYNLFLQILDDGKLHDKLGKEGDFTNSVVLFTSNVGAQWLMPELENGNVPNTDTLREMLAERQREFKPEFLNRLSDIIPFKPLGNAAIELIFAIQLKKLNQSLAEQEIELTVSENAQQKLIEMGYSKEFGARPLLGVMRNYLRRPISNKLVAGEITPSSKVQLELDESGNWNWQVGIQG